MPPEPLPWDRKDFFKERKHERSESLGSVARWRDSSHHRDFNRWGSADFRRPPGHGKQGGWHLFSEEPGHGYALSRSVDKMLEEDNRLSVSRGDGKYGRNSRENRGPFSQRDWRGNSWETTNCSLNLSRRPPDVNNAQRSVDEILTYSSHPHSEFVNSWDQHHLKDQHDKIGAVNGLGTGQRCDRDNSLSSIAWKPLKWSRSGSLSSWGSGFSHSSSSRSIGGADSNEAKAELQPKNSTAVESHSEEAAACVTSSAPSEDTTSKKKPRLNWGEGLAKYEKKKIDGPDLSVKKGSPVLSTANMEPCNFLGSSLVDKSPKVTGFSDSASPATPSSVACSSSPGAEDKLFGKAASMDSDICNLSSSPGPGSQNHLQRFPFNLEKLDIDSLTSLGSALNELVQSDDQSYLDSGLVRSTVMNKLLVLKADISKILEMTESEIDSLENELKSLKSVSGDGCFGPGSVASGSLLVLNYAKSSGEHVGGSNKVTRPGTLQIVSSDEPNVERMPLSSNLCSIHENGKEEEIDSPGTATSKLLEPWPLIKVVSSGDARRYDNFSENVDDIPSTAMKCLAPCSTVKDASVSACGDGNRLVKDGMDATFGASLCSSTENVLFSTIICSNKEAANRACGVFDKLLPKECCKIGNVVASSNSCSHNGTFIMEKFAERKRFARFKERAITLKFKTLHHRWKEDIRVLSVKKSRPKSLRKPELSVRTTCSSYHKNRSSSRSRFPFPGNHPSLVPTTEIINFTSKLLSESHVKVHRNTLKMPALILDETEKRISKFISSNGLVEDPMAIEKERAMINPWTSEEREIFLEKFAAFGKDFRKIASFLDHKTTADCVEFYYKYHKSDGFEKFKKKDVLGKSLSAKTVLLASGKKWNHEANVAALDILSAASVVADGMASNRRMRAGRFLLGAYGNMKTSRGEDSIVERSSSFDILGDEREAVAADVLAGICGSLSSEAMSSCITGSVHPAEGNRERKFLKVNPLCKQPLIPDVTQNVDDDTCSDDSCGEMDSTDWTDEEKAAFLQAVLSFGKDFTKIAWSVGTKSEEQCQVFFSKARKCLGLDLIHPKSENVLSPEKGDANGGVSDTDNACVLEAGSTIGSGQAAINKEDSLDVEKDDAKKLRGAVTEFISVTEIIEPSEFDSVAEDRLVSEISSWGGLGSEFEGPRLSSALYLDHGYEKREADTGVAVKLKSSVQDSSTTVNASLSSVGNSCPGLSFDTEYKLVSLKKPLMSAVSMEDLHATANSMVQRTAAADVHSEKTASQDRLSSTCDLQGSRDVCCHYSVSNGEHQLSNPGKLLDHVEATSILQGYPLQVPFKKEVNRGMSCSSSDIELPILSQKIEQTNDHYKDRVQHLSDSGKASRSGNVKLFGKILTNPSSTPKPNLTTTRSEENGIHHSRLSSKSSGVKLNGHHTADGNLTMFRFDHNDHNDYLSLENLPMRSYGFWDGNRIQTGFSSLPDPAILLTKYPAAFSNYSASSAKLEQQSLQAFAKNNERHLNSASAFTGEVNTSNGLIDHQMFRSRDGPVVQPFMVDVKHRQDVFSEIQRRNSFEVVSSLQQQVRGGMVGMNVVGRSGSLVGGSHGVSDPVASIRMHYSNPDQFGGQVVSITRENEPWGGEGNLGR